MGECRKEGKEFNLYCTYCLKYVWPVFKHNTPTVLLRFPKSLIFCKFCEEILDRIHQEKENKIVHTCRVDRRIDGSWVIGGMFCIWCDKLFFNKGNDINDKIIQIHVKVAHEKQYEHYLKKKCECMKTRAFLFYVKEVREVISDIEMYRNNYFDCGCHKCL